MQEQVPISFHHISLLLHNHCHSHHPQAEEKSLNLTKFTEHFNNMSYWTRTIILQQPDAKVVTILMTIILTIILTIMLTMMMTMMMTTKMMTMITAIVTTMMTIMMINLISGA